MRLIKYVTIVLFLGSACSSRVPSKDLPSWVLNTPAGCGMGSIQGLASLSLAKTGAMARGRDELAKQLQTRVENIMRSYRAEGGSENQDFDEELLVNISRQSSSALLKGTIAKEIYVDENAPRTLYALVCYEPSQIPSFMKTFEQLPIKHRATIRERAKQSFQELEELMKEYDHL